MIINKAVIDLGNVMLQTTCPIFDNYDYKHKGLEVIALNDYHPQDDLTDNYEVALWGVRDIGHESFRYCQQVVQGQGKKATIITPERTVAARENAPISNATISGFDKGQSPFELSMQLIRYTHETVNYYATDHVKEPYHIHF